MARTGPESIPVGPRPAPPKPKPNYSRRIIWLGAIVVLLVAGYTGAWFWAANRLETEAVRAIARVDRDPVRAECADLRAGGFPFRIGLFCDRVSFRDERRGVGVETGSFRSAAQIYNPFLVVSEIDGPAKISAPDLVPLDLDWDVLKASVRLDRPLPERISTEARTFKVTGPDGVLLSAADVQGHVRRNGADLDLAGSMQGLVLSPQLAKGRTIPPLAGTLDATMTDGVAWVLGGDKSLRGRSGVVRDLRLITGEKGSLSLAGPFSVDAEGLLDAELTLSLSGADEVANVLAEAIPDQASAIRTGFSGLAVLGEKPSIPLKIEKGRIAMGFIRLGRVPPLR